MKKTRTQPATTLKKMAGMVTGTTKRKLARVKRNPLRVERNQNLNDRPKKPKFGDTGRGGYYSLVAW